IPPTDGKAGINWPINDSVKYYHPMDDTGEVKNVLVTGSAGRIGQAVVTELLSRGHLVQGYDRHPSPKLENAFLAELSNLEDLSKAMDGVETLVHLAATPDDVDDALGELFPPNINGLYHVMESARVSGVRRIVLASSGQVNWFRSFNGPWPIDEKTITTPKGWYAATKMFLESIGYSYSVNHGMSVIVARLGWCPRDEGQVREIAAEINFKDVYLSPGDAGRFFAGCVEAAADVPHSILYATSKPVHTLRYDLGPAKVIANYEPQEQWPDGTEIITGQRWEN
nr:NAD(P)-dependent oxidoreductase [Pseudomonadales bacterium]